MTTPHKHAEILRAIADGKEVQWRDPVSRRWFAIKHLEDMLKQAKENCDGFAALVKGDTQ